MSIKKMRKQNGLLDYTSQFMGGISFGIIGIWFLSDVLSFRNILSNPELDNIRNLVILSFVFQAVFYIVAIGHIKRITKKLSVKK